MPPHLLDFLFSTDVLSQYCFQITIRLSIIQRPRHLGQGKMGQSILIRLGRKCFLKACLQDIPTLYTKLSFAGILKHDTLKWTFKCGCLPKNWKEQGIGRPSVKTKFFLGGREGCGKTLRFHPKHQHKQKGLRCTIFFFIIQFPLSTSPEQSFMYKKQAVGCVFHGTEDSVR